MISFCVLECIEMFWFWCVLVQIKSESILELSAGISRNIKIQEYKDRERLKVYTTYFSTCSVLTFQFWKYALTVPKLTVLICTSAHRNPNISIYPSIYNSVFSCLCSFLLKLLFYPISCKRTDNWYCHNCAFLFHNFGFQSYIYILSWHKRKLKETKDIVFCYLIGTYIALFMISIKV